MENNHNTVLKKIWDNRVLTLVFIAFFIFLRLSPMMFDGWAGSQYYETNGGIIHWLTYVLGDYRKWINGRVSSNFWCGIFESFQSGIAIDIVSAMILTVILECLLFFADIKSNIRLQLQASLVYFSFIILMPYVIRTYVIQIALIQYVTPILFMMWALRLDVLRRDHEDTKYTIYLLLLSVMAGAWMENTSVAYGIILAILFVRELVMKHRIDKGLLGAIIVTLIMGCVMVMSQGMYTSRIAMKGTEPFVLITWNRIFQHIRIWFMTFLYNSAIANILLMIIFACFSGYLFSKTKGIKKYIHLLMLMVDLLAACLFGVLGNKTDEFIYSKLFNETYLSGMCENHPYLISIITCGYIMWGMLYAIILSRYLPVILHIYLYGMIAVLVMLPTNQMGYRIDSPLYFSIICVAVMVICTMRRECCTSNSKFKQLTTAVVVLVAVFGIDYYAQMCSDLYTVGRQRNERIAYLKETQFLNQDSKEQAYVLPYYNEREAFQGGFVVKGTFHYPQFLAFYGLDEDTNIVFANNERIYLDCVNEDNKAMKLSVVNNLSDDYVYNQYIYFREYSYGEYVMVDARTGLSELEYVLYPNHGDGYYKVKMEYVNVKTGEVNDFERELEMYLIKDN